MSRLFILILLVVIQVLSKNYYVNTLKTGSNTGLSWENAWHDFSSVDWAKVGPGDTIFISGGTDTAFYHDTLKIGKSGELNNPIVVTIGREPGYNGIAFLNKTVQVLYGKKHLIIDGSNGTTKERRIVISDTTGADNIYIYLAESLIVKNLDVRNGKSHGIRINYKSYFISIENCLIQNQTWDGINITVVDTLRNLHNKYDSYLITNCEIKNIGDDLIQLGTNSVTISKCLLKHGERKATEGAHQDGIQINPGQKYIDVNSCTIIDCPQGVFVERSVGFINIYNNIFYETDSLKNLYNRAISLNENDIGLKGRLCIANNAFYNHKWAAILFNPDTFEVDDDVVIVNNIFYNCTRYTLGKYNQAHIKSTNIFFNNLDNNTLPLLPDSGINDDPMFMDPGNYDFRLHPCSPAINSGTSLDSWFEQDIIGTKRIHGSKWDIGPYEFIGTPDQSNCKSLDDNSIGVYNLRIENANYLKADTVYKITWAAKANAVIEECSLYVKYDTESKWLPMGKTFGNTMQYKWSFPYNGKSTCRIKIVVFGEKGQVDSTISDTYNTKKKSNLKLQVNAITDNTVTLHWDPELLDTLNVTSLMVAFGLARPVLTYPVSNVDTLHYNLQCTTDTIKNLQAGKQYYFSAFLLNSNGEYTLAGPLAQDSVLMKDLIPPENNFQLIAAPDTMIIQLTWETIVDLPYDADSIGIFMCEFRYPVNYQDSAATLIYKNSVVKTGSYTVKDLKANQNYYFALMVRDFSGNWSEPSECSITRTRLIRSDNFSKEGAVEITPSDTETVFNDSLLIWNTSDITFIDTIDSWKGPLHGFVIVSPGYVFRNGKKISQPLWIKIPYISTLKPENALKVNLYSYDIYKGGWIVSYDSIKVDTVNHTISAKNTAISFPFMFLIDTLAPVIQEVSNSDVAVISGQRIEDTLFITDNIKNFKKQFIAGPGDDASLDLSPYILMIDSINSPQVLAITLPSGIASECTGLWAQFIVSDKVNQKTVDMSKAVKRENGNCDNFTTTALQWAPVVVSANLDNPELKSVMALSNGKKNWSYNTKEMRIIKWIPGHQKAFDGGWVEYNESENSLFQIKPGELLWIKTKERLNLDFGSAVVPKLNAVDTINIPPNQWTDFSNPFPFDIYLGDIFKTTSNPQIDSSIRVYSWDKDSINRSYNTNLLYISGFSGHGEPNASIKKLQSYTVFNNANVPVSLQIPAISTEASAFVNTQRPLRKKKNNSHWSLSIKSWGSDNINNASVYLGENSALSKEITSPLSPSFSSQNISIYDKNRKKTWGVVVSPKESESGSYFEILIENSASNAATVRTVVGEMFNIEQSHFIRWYDTEKDIWTRAQDTMEVSLKPKQRLVKIIAIGNEQYFRDLRSIVRRNVLALRAVYPNPFARAFTIQYSLPYETRKVTFLVFDLLGKVIWQRDINDIHPGPSMIRVDKMMATGLHVLQMRVFMDDQGSPKVFNRRVMCVR